jgi:hypothetical protein
MSTKSSVKTRKPKKITGAEFDAMFDRGEDITPYVDFKNVVVGLPFNFEFSTWMLEILDREARKLNISRQAVIKMWITDRLNAERRKRGC